MPGKRIYIFGLRTYFWPERLPVQASTKKVLKRLVNLLKIKMFQPTLAAIFGILLGTCPAYCVEECAQVLLQRQHVSGLTFQVCRADMIDNAECSRQKAEGAICPPYSFVLVVKIINQSDTKKIEFNGPLRYDLEDNFQNTYNVLQSIRLHGKESNNTNGASVRSLYPQDYILDKVFFEAPVAMFQSLTLSINAASCGIEPAVITMPLYKEMVRLPDQSPPPISPFMTVIDIVKPKPDTSVKPGDVVPLQIRLNEQYSRPDTILIIAPNYTLEDIYHSYNYNIRIPDNWKPGRPYQVAILAKWGQGQDERVDSESITLNVIDPYENCRGQCPTRK